MATVPREVARVSFCTFTSLRCASRAVAHLYDMVLAPSGLKATQFMILRVIAESEEIAQCDLAADFALSLETLSRRLSWARKAEFVSVRLGEHGRRLYRLTPLGELKLAAARPYWLRAHERMKEALGPDDWELICTLVDRVTSAAQRAETLRRFNGGNGR